MPRWTIPASNPNMGDIRRIIGLGYQPYFSPYYSERQLEFNEVGNRLYNIGGTNFNQWRNREYFRAYIYTSSISQGYTGTTYPTTRTYSSGLPIYGNGVESDNFWTSQYSFIRATTYAQYQYAFNYWSYYGGGGGGVYSYSPTINIYYYDWPISNNQIWANWRYVGGGYRPPQR